MKIAVIGQGYVGFPLAQLAAKSGFEVIGYDTNSNVINSLDNSEAKLKLTDDEGLLKDCQIYVIAVPTPLDAAGKPDLSYVIKASKTLTKYAVSGSLVINESTSYPGTLREVILPIVDPSGVKVLFASAPERIDPLNKNWNLKNTARVIGGLTQEATSKAEQFYATFCEQVHTVSSPEVAESAKLLENTFRQVNIAFINQFTQIMDKLNIPVHEVIEAANSKPFGFMKFIPGLGVGGHCIPIDPIYLAEKAESAGAPASLIRSADQINAQMSKFVMDKAIRLLGSELSGKKVCIVGLSYKSDISDLRSSPSLALWDLLEAAKAQVSYHDSFHPTFRGVNCVDLSTSQFDLAIVATRHSDLNTSGLISSSGLVLDCTATIAGVHWL
jgi:UDP-N-acetyl-D-glucosamine dehydrogenase